MLLHFCNYCAHYCKSLALIFFSRSCNMPSKHTVIRPCPNKDPHRSPHCHDSRTVSEQLFCATFVFLVIYRRSRNGCHLITVLSVKDSCNSMLSPVCINDIMSCIGSLKHHKAAGLDNITNEHLLFAGSPIFVMCICLYFSLQ